MPVPEQPKIYHIVHVDRLPSIIADGYLWCDAKMTNRSATGTTIGMPDLKKSRLGKELPAHTDLRVGDCVPFYFCYRSVMLYVIYRRNHPGLAYRGGQCPIVHLEADLYETVARADANQRRWAFTSSNAVSGYFNAYSDITQLSNLDWDAINARDWRGRRDGKQAEFLVEESFPWNLVRRVGVYSPQIRARALAAMEEADHQPLVEIKRDWYY